ncbi:hypothetical protein [Rhodococcus jostii]|uniref:Secreted protein n=1 Tax=Rhodococcus jostii TaxID=132919 RepID=A0ABU4CNY7_RHOJO|nr:hypothetical protein [Rhodococcus jostii]MDV6284963.1 hypothetical protein [Rhodococcus jostii]
MSNKTLHISIGCIIGLAAAFTRRCIAPTHTGETRKGTPVVGLSDKAVAIVGHDARDEYRYVVSIDSTSEVDARRDDSLALFMRLQKTPWALLLTSDDDDIEQVRPAS